MNIRYLIIIILGFVILLGGCTSTITPARDLTGQWNGIVSFTERSPKCSYQGDMILNLRQQGDNINGNFNIVVTKAEGNDCVRIGSQFGYLVSGTVSSSAISLLVADTDVLLGSFTTDIMTLRWESCQDCSSGPAIKILGPVSLLRQR